MATYKALTGLDYAGKRAEAGDLIDDLPSRSITWLLDQGLIERTESSKPAKREPESPKKEA